VLIQEGTSFLSAVQHISSDQVGANLPHPSLRSHDPQRKNLCREISSDLVKVNQNRPDSNIKLAMMVKR
jgi:hypothetical protein